MRGRRTRMSIMAVAYTAAVLVGLAAIAVVSARRGPRFDLTERKIHSLKPATAALLASIPEGAEPVDMIAVTSAVLARGDAREAQMQVSPLLSVFANSSDKVRVSVRLAENEPALVENLGIDRLPVVVLHWQPPTGADGATPPARERRTLVVTEDGVAQALRDLIEDRKRVAYLLFGHEEMRQSDTGATGFSLASQVLSGLNFETRELALLGPADVPQDADLVVLAGPQADLLPSETAALGRFADRGGNILVLDGPTRQAGQLAELHGWLAGTWNCVPRDGVVADFEVPLGADPRILLVLPPKDEPHPIVAGMAKVMQLPLTRSLVFPDQALDGVAVATILSSGERSWLETDFSSVTPRYDEGADQQGPLAVAFAVTRDPPGDVPESRLVVFGSRIAFANQYIGSGGNIDLLRNTVDWLTRREADIAARRGAGEDGGIVISERQGRIIVGSSLILPMVVAATAIAFWWRRRRL